jgi:hypothetical protein
MAMQHPKTWNGNAIAMQDRNGRNETIIETIALQLQCDCNAIAMRPKTTKTISMRSQCDRTSQTTETIANRKNHFKSMRSQCDRSTAKNRT